MAYENPSRGGGGGGSSSSGGGGEKTQKKKKMRIRLKRPGRKKKAADGTDGSISDSRSGTSSNYAYETTTASNTKDPSGRNRTKKTFGSRVKGLFRGRTQSGGDGSKKSKKKGGKSSNGSESSSQVDISPYDDDMNRGKKAPMMPGGLPTKLDDELLATLQEEDEEMSNMFHQDGKLGGPTKKKSFHAEQSDDEDDNPLGEEDDTTLLIVLLLIDPVSLRFELLQLEFDSTIAKVSDTLAQVAGSVTEKAILNTEYRGVMDGTMTERSLETNLGEFCAKSKDVLVALPQGTSVAECARLARPILSDEKVVNLVSSSKFDLIL